jgi:hypothetical protein
MKDNEKPHEITEREKRAWKEGAKPRKRDRPNLTMPQRIEFLKLVAQLASNSTFERKFGLDPADVEYYKKQFDVESQDDARRLYKRLEIDMIEGNEERIISETGKARDAEAVANLRLKELELRKTIEKREKAVGTPDGNKVRAEDAERQQRFQQEQEAQTAEALSKSEPWFLPLEGTESDRRGITERFRRDIEHCGMQFCINKYQASPIQLKAEATRLGLRINWDRVKR